MTRLALLLVLFLASCGGPYTGNNQYGADEFVLDSYKIREGKISILELEGVNVEELDVRCLTECEGKSGQVDLLGHIAVPSVHVDGKARLYDVLFQARLTPDANLFKSYVLRNGCMLPVDLQRLIKQGDMSQNIVMQGGDKVYIADSSSASLMVMGEVEKQRTISLPDGVISLRQALAEAGGIRYTGDASYIQVIRGSLCKPKIYTLSWEHVIQMPNNSLLLIPGDIVYVASKPITEWHRFISQLVPSFFAPM